MLLLVLVLGREGRDDVDLVVEDNDIELVVEEQKLVVLLKESDVEKKKEFSPSSVDDSDSSDEFC